MEPDKGLSIAMDSSGMSLFKSYCLRQMRDNPCNSQEQLWLLLKTRSILLRNKKLCSA